MRSLFIVLISLSSACTTALYQRQGRDTAAVATISTGENATLASIDNVRVNGGRWANYVVQADFDSPWGWLVDSGVLFAETWHTAMALSIRYTSMQYHVASKQIDASNVGIGLTFYVNP